MKANFFTFIISFIFTIIAFIGSLVLEYHFNLVEHANYWANILIGIFASGILLVVSSLIGYYQAKNDYYFYMHNKSIESIELINDFLSSLKNGNQIQTSKYISAMKDNIAYIAQLYQGFITFKNSKKDLIYQSILSELLDYIYLQNELFTLWTPEISKSDFKKIINELDKQYYDKLHPLHELITATDFIRKNYKPIKSILDKK